jgi:drug/metabolite transporter (DMT)-like permease
VVFGVLFGWLFYKEVLTIYSLIGGALILFGAALPNLNFKKKTQLGSTNLC